MEILGSWLLVAWASNSKGPLIHAFRGVPSGWHALGKDWCKMPLSLHKIFDTFGLDAFTRLPVCWPALSRWRNRVRMLHGRTTRLEFTVKRMTRLRMIQHSTLLPPPRYLMPVLRQKRLVALYLVISWLQLWCSLCYVTRYLAKGCQSWGCWMCYQHGSTCETSSCVCLSGSNYSSLIYSRGCTHNHTPYVSWNFSETLVFYFI